MNPIHFYNLRLYSRTRFLPIITIIIFMISGCKIPMQERGYLNFFVGDVEIVKKDGKTEAPEIKKEIFRDDTIKTHEKSMAFVQIGSESVIQIFENTEFRTEAVKEFVAPNGELTTLEIVSGSASFYAEKLRENCKLVVKGINTIMSVRGTIFYVEQEKDICRIVVKEGVVAVKSNAAGAEDVMVNAGEKAEAAGAEIKIDKMEEADETHFSQIKEIRPIPGIKCASPEEIERFFKWRLGTKGAAEKERAEVEPEAAPEDGKKAAIKKTEKKEKKITAAEETGKKARLLVKQLSASGVSASEAKEITEKLYAKISAIKGAENVVYRSAGDKRSANRILKGRISMLGKSRIIAVDVLNGDKGKLIFNASVTVKAGESPDDYIDKLAKQIGEKAGIWE